MNKKLKFLTLKNLDSVIEDLQTELTEMENLRGIFQQLNEVFKEEYIGPWLKKKNKAFGGRTPLQVIKDGDSFLIEDMIDSLTDGTPS